MAPLGDSGSSFILNAGLLTGSVVTVALEVVAAGATGRASRNITIAVPPAGGTFNVRPSVGTGGVPVTLTASGWYSPPQPSALLLYLFEARDVTSGEILMSTVEPMPSTTVTVPCPHVAVDGLVDFALQVWPESPPSNIAPLRWRIQTGQRNRTLFLTTFFIVKNGRLRVSDSELERTT